MSRVSTATLYNSPVASAMTAQSRYAEATTQEASGLVSDTYGGYGYQAGKMLNLEFELTAAESYSSAATGASNKVQSMYSTIGDMITTLRTLATDLSSGITSASTDETTTAVTMKSEGASTLSTLVASLNTKYGDEYLFSGSATTTAPVSVTSWAPAVSSLSTPDTTYYQGDTTLSTCRVSDQQKVSWGVLASNTSFEEALRAAYTVSIADPADSTTLISSSYTGTLQAAYDLVQTALTDLSNLQASVSQTASTLTDAADRQSSFATLLTSAVSDVKNVNTSAVALKVSEYQTMLSASYDAVAKIAKLSLTSYL